jgi:hypothetical protein
MPPRALKVLAFNCSLKSANRIRNEPRAHGVHMAVAIASLLGRKEALRHDHMQMVLRARHRDIKQAALFLDLGCAADREVRRYAAVHAIEDKDGFPFLTLG